MRQNFLGVSHRRVFPRAVQMSEIYNLEKIWRWQVPTIRSKQIKKCCRDLWMPKNSSYFVKSSGERRSNSTLYYVTTGLQCSILEMDYKSKPSIDWSNRLCFFLTVDLVSLQIFSPNNSSPSLNFTLHISNNASEKTWFKVRKTANKNIALAPRDKSSTMHFSLKIRPGVNWHFNFISRIEGRLSNFQPVRLHLNDTESTIILKTGQCKSSITETRSIHSYGPIQKKVRVLSTKHDRLPSH